MTHDEYKGLLIVVSAAALHALLAKHSRSTDQLAREAVVVAQQLLDEVDDAVDGREHY
jgi:hypothetical protein